MIGSASVRITTASLALENGFALTSPEHPDEFPSSTHRETCTCAGKLDFDLKPPADVAERLRRDRVKCSNAVAPASPATSPASYVRVSAVELAVEPAAASVPQPNVELAVEPAPFASVQQPNVE